MVRIGSLFALLFLLLSSCSPAASNLDQTNPALTAGAAEAGAAAQERGQASEPAAGVSAAGVPTAYEPTEEPASPAQQAQLAAAPTVEPVHPEPGPDGDQAGRSAAPGAVGPDAFPEGVNPLTGLPVGDAQNLALSPALVSVTNFPITARPQAGLSFSPFVFEMYIGEGMTRFLALFYGDYPQQPEAGESDAAGVPAGESIGPVRSGRLPYDSLRRLYNGFLVMASASQNVLPSLGNFANVWGADTGDINSAMIPVSKLQAIAENSPVTLKEGALSGLRFDAQVPAGGKTASMLWIAYNYLNQVIWRYDPAGGAYLRYQDNADGQTFTQATDRLNGEPLTYENVVVLFANHRARAETLIDIDLMYIDRMPALLFRDGQMYEIFWTTANTEFEQSTGLVRPIRFIDAQGQPFALKPGQTWVEIVQPYTRYNETVDSEVYMDLKRKQEPGSGIWAVHFYPTAPEE